MKLKTFILVLAIFNILPAQYQQEQAGYFAQPLFSEYGIVATDNFAASIYLLTDKIQIPVSAAGCGNYYRLSPDGKTLGFKLIDENGMQAAALLNLQTGAVNLLHEKSDRAGQPQFLSNSTIYFTIDTKLYIKHQQQTGEFELGYYANIVSVSEDLQMAAYNNAGDQIVLQNLTNGNSSIISDGESGYFLPQWSPAGQHLLYSSTAGELHLYDSRTGQSFGIGSGLKPAWSPHGDQILFYRQDITNMRLNSSDIYLYDVPTGQTVQLTATPDIFEMDAAFSANSNRIIFHTYDNNEIFIADFDRQQKRILTRKKIFSGSPTVKYHRIIKESQKSSHMDLPYIHQVYDTPNWFNGHWACAPTASMMLLAHHNVLPYWNTYCRSPYQHYTVWGRYIAARYRFMGFDYSLAADDPNGNPGYGAYGYMWNTGSPHTRMEGFYEKHGFNAYMKDSPDHTRAINQINAGQPFTICVGLTSSGHLVLAHGTGAEEHTLVTNDPYGDKNTYGYPSYDGKNAYYDWPGYNNGYQNLQTVYWSVQATYDKGLPQDTLIVDDLDMQERFYLHTKSPATMDYWWDAKTGLYGHAWYTYTTVSDTLDTCYAAWRPNLPQAGLYRVMAYIPDISGAAGAARYRVYHTYGTDTLVINQDDHRGSWVSLGEFEFSAGDSGYVYLGDGSTIAGEKLLYDAMAFHGNRINAISGKEKDIQNEFMLFQNFPNPFNPVTSIEIHIVQPGRYRLQVFDIRGQIVNTLLDENLKTGSQRIEFDGSGLPSGTYFYRLQSGNFSETRKLLLLK